MAKVSQRCEHPAPVGYTKATRNTSVVPRSTPTADNTCSNMLNSSRRRLHRSHRDMTASAKSAWSFRRLTAAVRGPFLRSGTRASHFGHGAAAPLTCFGHTPWIHELLEDAQHGIVRSGPSPPCELYVGWTLRCHEQRVAVAFSLPRSWLGLPIVQKSDWRSSAHEAETQTLCRASNVSPASH